VAGVDGRWKASLRPLRDGRPLVLHLIADRGLAIFSAFSIFFKRLGESL